METGGWSDPGGGSRNRCLTPCPAERQDSNGPPSNLGDPNVCTPSTSKTSPSPFQNETGERARRDRLPFPHFLFSSSEKEIGVMKE